MQISLSDLSERLKSLTGPDRRVDIEIAMLSGYRREINEADRRVLWFDPKGTDPVRIPPYTASVDHAREFAEFVAPDHVGGCSWERGMGSAKLNSGPYIEASTPALALCLAAVNELIQRQSRQ